MARRSIIDMDMAGHFKASRKYSVLLHMESIVVFRYYPTYLPRRNINPHIPQLLQQQWLRDMAMIVLQQHNSGLKCPLTESGNLPLIRLPDGSRQHSSR